MALKSCNLGAWTHSTHYRVVRRKLYMQMLMQIRKKTECNFSNFPTKKGFIKKGIISAMFSFSFMSYEPLGTQRM